MGKNKSDNLKNKRNYLDNIIDIVARLADHKGLSSVRDTFALLLPLIITGAIGILGVTFIFGGYGAQSSSILGWIAKASGGIHVKSSGTWEFLGAWKTISLNGQHIFKFLNVATFGYLAFYVSFVLGVVYSKAKGAKSPILGGVVSLMIFLICGGINPNFSGANGLLPALLLSFLTVTAYTFLERQEKLQVKMPKGVPPAVARSFSALFPIVFVSLSFAFINYLFWAGGYYGNITIMNKGAIMIAPIDQSFISMFYKGVTAPFLTFVGSKAAGFGIMIIYLLFVGFFWWCGIHGTNLLNGIFYPIWFGLIIANSQAVESYGSYEAALQAGKLSIANWGFIEQFILPTGWSMTGMLVLGSAIFSNNPQWKNVNKIAGPAAVFNINEPVTYGYPIMLNPVLLIPTLLAMPIAGTMAYLSTSFGWMRVAYIYVPWPLPTPIGGILTTGFDWRAAPILITILATIFIWYLPFIFIDNKIQKKLGIGTKSMIQKIRIKKNGRNVKSEE